jgi:PEGA domain
MSSQAPEIVEDAGPSRWSSVVDWLREARPSIVRWLPYAAIVAGVGIALGLVAPYVFRTADSLKTRIEAVTPELTRPPAPVHASAAGELRVESTPAGAAVLIDGKSRGVTPLTITGLPPGRHEVLIKSDAGSVRRTVTVSTKEATEVNEAIFSGWLAMYPPFDVVIAEGGQVLQPDGRNQIMLPPGVHSLQITNRALGYSIVQQVEVFPGAGTDVRLPMPTSTLTVTASEAAEVWLDGVRVSDAPVSALPLPLGAHEIVVKRQAGGEKRFPVTISAKPFTLNVDFP